MINFIEVKDVSKSFWINKRSAGVMGMLSNFVAPKYEKKQAVDHISFSIEEGEMVGFIGPNGGR